MSTRTAIGRARLFGLGGAGLTLTGLALTLLPWWLVPTGDAIPARLERALTLDALLVLLALLRVFSSRWPLFSAVVLSAAFAGSFLAELGWYLVMLPSPLALVGVGGLLYLVAASMMVVTFAEPPRREAG